MKNLLAAALLAGAATLGATVASTPAEARDGCGRGAHRGPAGYCRPNIGNRVYVAPGRLVVGRFYERRGYWDGRRYWQHRYRYRNGWRYR
ncbi:GCG_CRPN prefix-to-repeats domain-containing protein [Sphingomonas sp. MMS24-J45]|uniref:GCG_CRPN prefix-to-repeats domain-containing protein n=1 Tax=Sphingomonas sp. MMS24-J45 TaxID=3238806 RepID=UPI00384C1630